MHYEYQCVRVAGPAIPWEEIAGLELAGTVGGEPPRLRTVVKMCRTDDCVHVRFECEDDHVVAFYTNRDDPIYKEDVVEVFIDEEGAGTHYKEYEFSPRNVVFDALIEKRPDERPNVNTAWDHNGLRSEVQARGDGTIVYEIAFPVKAFDKPPSPGTSWRVNFYRIDDDPQGQRHYWAWSPTGKVDFHRPERFGNITFGA